MAVGVYSPKRSQTGDGLSKLLTVGGAVAGGIVGGAGGPGGAMMGASAGGGLGGMFGGLAQSQQPAGPEPIQAGGDAMSRRMGQLDQTPLRQIRESIDSLKYIEDPAQRAELAKPLLMADFAARRKA